MEKDINFGIKHGQDLIESEEDLILNIVKEDIYITEVPAGASSGGVKLFAAAILVALMWWNPVGWGAGGLFATGGTGAGGAFAAGSSFTLLGQVTFALAVNLAISGVSELLMPGPQTDKSGNTKYYFGGPINTIKQGQPVPICYGELIIGGAPISINFTKRSINTSGFLYNSNNSKGKGSGSFDGTSGYPQ
jgi:predicted phage tail protein